MKKTCVISFLFIIILIFTASVVSGDEEVEGFFPEKELYLLPETGTDSLNEVLDVESLKAYLHDQFAAFNTEIDFSSFRIPYTIDNANAISRLIWEEMPEDYHVELKSIPYSSDVFTSIVVRYLCTKDEYQEKWAIWEKTLDKMLSGIVGNESLTDVQKALLIHDRMIYYCEYDYQNYLNGTIPAESYSLYGVMINGKAVCQGYAETYKYLLGKVGIEAYVCTSNALNHAWNIVKIDGEYYFVDVTWDDPVWDVSGRVYHDYFLLSTSAFMPSHNATDYDTIPTDTTYDHYFWKNSNAAFQLVNGSIYYIDGKNNTLNLYSGTVLAKLSDQWPVGEYSYWVGNFSRLCSDGKNLFYSLSDAIYKYDITENKTEKVYEPNQTFGDYYSIFGFKYEDGNLICELSDSPQFNGNTKRLYTLIGHYKEDNAGSYCITGHIISYNPNNATTVELVQNGAVKYSTTIDATTGNGQVTQEFTLTEVESGTYDLVVTKAGHLAYTITDVVVADEDIDLTMSNRAYANITMIAGDVNEDGFVNSTDWSILWSDANYLKPTGSAQDKLADINGDGAVNSVDWSILWNDAHYLKGKDKTTSMYCAE